MEDSLVKSVSLIWGNSISARGGLSFKTSCALSSSLPSFPFIPSLLPEEKKWRYNSLSLSTSFVRLSPHVTVGKDVDEERTETIGRGRLPVSPKRMVMYVDQLEDLMVVLKVQSIDLNTLSLFSVVFHMSWHSMRLFQNISAFKQQFSSEVGEWKSYNAMIVTEPDLNKASCLVPYH